MTEVRELTEPRTATRTAVIAEDVHRAFGDREILRGVDLRVRQGEFLALLGASGSGKSTLLRIVGALDHGARGKVAVPARTSVAFQEPRLLPWRRVWRNVAFGLPAAGRRQRALAALDEVGLTHVADAWPKTLSGGEAQRVALARALVRDPQLLLLDEPLASLDALTRLKMQQLIAQLWARHRLTAILVTHDVDEALVLADRAVVLRDGRLAEELPVTLDRPRDPGSEQFAVLRARLLGWLGVTVPRS
ncbi:ABC transporter ATP-binding protein [Amycolatopsis tucumanensis]|uniref:ABC transporter ATP-binding protein n=1 Tax=Amycolatopsis tucumanensis TaxID=401106 RepID=A0ABP7HDY5_9PSEU|nr:ABC transporter ATP-binding protein [Amycolatopsis tucumanensis]MCF6425390.1 ABC transporter ATP-binding protein [Amycolatopsis tucumanensis]